PHRRLDARAAPGDRPRPAWVLGSEGRGRDDPREEQDRDGRHCPARARPRPAADVRLRRSRPNGARDVPDARENLPMTGPAKTLLVIAALAAVPLLAGWAPPQDSERARPTDPLRQEASWSFAV